jgi:hypothetical protein
MSFEDDKKDAVDRLLDAARQYDNAGNAAAAAEARDAAARAENADNPDDLRDIEREFNAGAPSPIQFEDDVITPGDPGEGGEPGGGVANPVVGVANPVAGVTTAEVAETSNLWSSAR